jgi:UDP-sugar diphosphatase
MIKIEKLEKLTSCDETRFIKPARLWYLQDGVRKSWEVVKTHDSVAILLYDESHDAFVLVKQFRPAVYLKNSDGYTYELCAGLVDKAKPVETIAAEEVMEECGYAIKTSALERITSFFTAVGFAGGEQTLFFATVNDSMRVDEGGGIDDEQIEVVKLPVAEAKKFMFDESKAKTPGLMFAFLWFMERYDK